MGDGAFLMNSQEIETALREHIPPWPSSSGSDDSYGLIKWKMDLELGHDVDVDFGNPDFVVYAESFGARGYWVASAGELLPTLTLQALASETVSIVTCPVDYSENLRLSDALGKVCQAPSECGRTWAGTVPSLPAWIVLHRLDDLLLGVHHERPVVHDRLADRLATEQQHLEVRAGVLGRVGRQSQVSPGP